jgi:O-antigen ligase|tara:strand:- start:58 stop:1287 length:1230 start_codon:yes stop_codon:yes gene_type:complete
MILNKFTFNYFLILFCLIPVTIIIGSAFSVINILLIDLSFIILIVYKRNFFFLKSRPIIYLFVLYIYLIFNSFISLEFSEGALRNFGFLRIIILFAAFNYFFLDEKFYKKVFKFWLIVIFIVLADVFIETFMEKNIFGFDGKKYGHRIVSFFKDEPIVGGFLNGFYLILVGFLFNEVKKKNFLLSFVLTIVFMSAILLSGERSNTIKAFIGLGLFLFFIKTIDFKIKITLLTSAIILLIFTFMNSNYLQIRFINHIYSNFKEDPIYFDLYASGFQVFKNNKIFGVGNKNYRIETCANKETYAFKKSNKYLCNTHPHQIYFELLSEHGIVGSFIIIFILFKLIFSKIIKVLKTNNYLKLGSFIYMLLVFTPLLPGGAFFNNFLITIFTINLSIFYAVDKNSNIFRNENYR